ncbi:MFS transporter [Streptomyces sp. NPDC091280]|uniref:MFS transporter n=1 Tax=Streptomyces sp. NPDC091280 TaxID=3365984 RepID=UPI0037FA6729
MSNETTGEPRVETPRTTLEAEGVEAERLDMCPSDANNMDEEPEGIQSAAGISARLERLPFTRYHLQMAIVLALGGVCATFDLTSMDVMSTAVRDTFHLTAVEAGWAGAIALVGAVVGGRLTTVFGKRLAPRRVFAVSLIAYGVFSVVSGVAWNFTSLLVFRTLFGFGLGAMISQTAALVLESKGSPRHRWLAAGAVISPALGVLISPQLGPALLSAFSDETAWRVMLFIGGFPLLVGLYGVARLPESPRWLAAHGRYAEADRIVRATEDSVLRKGGHLPEPQIKDQADLDPHVPAVLAKPFVRRTIACVVLAVTCLFTYNVFFK